MNHAKAFIGSLLIVAVASGLAAAEEISTPPTMYLCRSPVLALDFWRSLQDMKNKGVRLNKTIVEQVCAGMHTPGGDPQCVVVVTKVPMKPVASGGGALALADGERRVWFHKPDTAGWVHPDYYIWMVNQPASGERQH